MPNQETWKAPLGQIPSEYSYISTAITELGFSIMNIVKTRLCNIKKADFLKGSLILYIKRQIVMQFNLV